MYRISCNMLVHIPSHGHGKNQQGFRGLGISTLTLARSRQGSGSVSARSLQACRHPSSQIRPEVSHLQSHSKNKRRTEMILSELFQHTCRLSHTSLTKLLLPPNTMQSRNASRFSHTCMHRLIISCRQHPYSALIAHVTNSQTTLQEQNMQSNIMPCSKFWAAKTPSTLHAVSAHVINSPTRSPGAEYAVEYHTMQ